MDTIYPRLDTDASERRYRRALTVTAVRPGTDLTGVTVTGDDVQTLTRPSSGRCPDCRHQLVLGDCSFCAYRSSAPAAPEPPTRPVDGAKFLALLLSTTLLSLATLVGVVLILAWVG